MHVSQRRKVIRPLGALAFLGALLVSLPAQAEPRIDITEEIGCLALNIYFEARGEPDLGKAAVKIALAMGLVPAGWWVIGRRPG